MIYSLLCGGYRTNAIKVPVIVRSTSFLTRSEMEQQNDVRRDGCYSDFGEITTP